ncbi:MAG: hypothetical protein CFE21_13795 [Bacteroidetes bacterium B1(2017)]|nr:MAG: hypothetical protein CFE21_13795 [Bacteroidetes bacterium B1(2017)]
MEIKKQLNAKFVLEPTLDNKFNLYYLNSTIAPDNYLLEAERKIWYQVNSNITDVYFNDSLVVVTNKEVKKTIYYVYFFGKESEYFTYFKAKDSILLGKGLTKIGINYKIELKSISDL